MGLLVLPFSATLELRGGKWPLGGTMCNIYVSLDVMLCAASILSLLAISVDRYLAISAPLSYMSRITATRVTVAIAAIWASSLAVSFVPIHLGWNTVDYRVQHLDWHVGDEDKEGRYCQFEWNNNYIVFYVLCSFYLPMLIICGMYLCIFRVARQQVQQIRATTPSFARTASTAAIATEHKATITLAAVLGAFVICWFPYFTFFTCTGIKEQMNPPTTLHSVLLWLGYFNSLLNPILYPALNRDFRKAYAELLLCRRPSRRKLRVYKRSSRSNKQRLPQVSEEHKETEMKNLNMQYNQNGISHESR
ncbi:histamine receptor H2b isoform X2 [Dunckerocampus dactyliophorus]|nr:histamine receptor H2b isoform X2 [Dunckerocampus dactyliophorus]